MDALASRSEHFSHGIDTDPLSIITMRASGVVSIAFAKTGFVLLGTIPSEMLLPSNNDLIEMLKDDLAYLASQTRCAVVFKLLNDIETVRMQPILALCISLHGMHVHRFVALVRVEIEPPALRIEK
jgi:hypothetical protein